MVKLQIWRPMGNLRYDLVGEVIAPIQKGYNSICPDNAISVTQGDVLGWYMEGVQAITHEKGKGRTVRRVYRTFGVVTSLDMASHSQGWLRSYSVRAVVVPETNGSMKLLSDG